jgi:hypothetical protein
MALRNKIVFFSKKAAMWCFLGAFIYLLIAKLTQEQYGFHKQYSVLFLLAALFFVGCMMLPPSLERKYTVILLQAYSFIGASLSFGFVFVSTFFILYL